MLGLYFEQRVAVSASVFMRRTTDWKSALYQHVCACPSRHVRPIFRGAGGGLCKCIHAQDD
jgi:hypothetical protein